MATGSAPLIDAAIKRELARFTEGEQESFLRDFLAERQHRVRQHTPAVAVTPRYPTTGWARAAAAQHNRRRLARRLGL
ncbi:MAG: hypothetical protein ACHQ9S_18465 [Candidatus Binatia bacterium]